MLLFRWIAAGFAATAFSAATVPAATPDVVMDQLIKAGWDRKSVAAVVAVHSVEFDLDAQAGWLERRLERLARLARYPDALRMVEQHPEYADLFVNAPEPDALARAIREIALDREDVARLLNLFIGWSTRSEIGHLQKVLERYGGTISRFVGAPELHDVAQALVLSQASGAPRAWQDWVASELPSQDSSSRLDEFLTIVELHGGAIARFMERQPGFEDDFPRLWGLFRDLLATQRNDEARGRMLGGLLSHQHMWLTLAHPYGNKVLLRAKDWAPNLLLTLWGTEGWVQPLEAAGPLLERKGPISPERRSWLIRGLASDDHSEQSLAEFGVMLHDTEAFWDVALDPERSDYLQCVLKLAQEDSGWNSSLEKPKGFIEAFRKRASLPVAALKRLCSPQPSILVRALPGYPTVKLLRDLFAGVPIDFVDVVSSASDLYVPSRYLMLLRPGTLLGDDALRIATRMSLDYRQTFRRAVLGKNQSVVPRRLFGKAQGFVLVSDGWLAPVPRDALRREGGFITRETLENLAIEGVANNDFASVVIMHFRCADSSGSGDPRCN